MRIRWYNPLSWIFGKKEQPLDFNSEFAVIRLTKPAIGSFINDQFNKKISHFSSWWHYKNDKPKKEIPYTKVDAINTKEVLGIPIIEERLINKIDFVQGENFGEVTNIIR